MGGVAPLVTTADELNSLEVCGCVASLEPQLCMFNCVDNYVGVVHLPSQKGSAMNFLGDQR